MASDYLNKKQLYDLVWQRPMTEVAKDYGLSDRGLAKLCERNSIPVPPRGYWAKKKAGQKVIKPPLLVLDPKEPETVVLMKQAVQKQQTLQKPEVSEPALPVEIREAIQREALPAHQVQVPKTLSNPHVIVAKRIQEEERQRESYRKFGGWSKPEPVTELEKRRRRIISALLKALEARGFKVEVERDYREYIWVTHQWDKLGFTVTERIRQYRRELTAEEKKDSWNSDRKWTQVREPTGLLMLRISSGPRCSSYDAGDFQETAEQPLEDRLNAVIVGIIERMWEIKKIRLKREEEERQRWNRHKEAEQQAKLLKEEQERKSALEAQAANWKKAEEIREYVAAVTTISEHPEDILNRWKEWALAHADAIDPIVSGDPLVPLAPVIEEEA